MSHTVMKHGMVYIVGLDGRFHFECRDVAELEARIGLPMLTAFAQLFFWSDRLGLLANALMKLTGSGEAGHQTAAERRDHMAIAFSTAGVLAEASHSIQDLERLGIKGMLPLSASLAKLIEMRKVWRGALAKYRNIFGFHACRSTIQAGVAWYKAQPDHGAECAEDDGKCGKSCRKNRLVVARSSGGGRYIDSSLEMGLALMIPGLGIEEAEFKALAERLAHDHGRFQQRVQRAFMMGWTPPATRHRRARVAAG